MRKSLAVFMCVAGVLGLFQNCSKFRSDEMRGTAILASTGELIEGISPTTVFTGGGTLSIRGKGFGPNTTVTIGDQACLDMQVRSETEITCDVPPADLPSVRAVVVAGAVLPQELTYIDFSKMTSLAGRSGLRGIVDGVGRLARLDQATALAVDGSTLYFAEGVLNAIRTVDLETNEVKLFAGVRDQDGGYNDGNVADARFSDIRAMVAARGNLYVGEFGNCAVRAIDLTTKQVTTLVGGPSPDEVCVPVDGPFETAKLGKVTALAVQGGFIYIGERLSSSAGIIRRIDLGARTITRVAGALIAEPPDLPSEWVPALSTLDREVTLATPLETPHPYGYDDSLTQTFTQPDAAAMRLHFSRVQVDPDDDSFRVSGNVSIRTIIDMEGADLTDYWTPIITENSVDLSVVNYGTGYGYRLDKVQYTTAIATDGPKMHSWDGSILEASISSVASLVVKGDALYFADDDLHVIRKADLKAGTITGVFGTRDEGKPVLGSYFDTSIAIIGGLTADGANLYVSDMQRDRILRYNLATRKISVAAWADPSAGAALNLDGPLTGAGMLTPTDLVYDGRRGLIFSVQSMLRRLK